MDGLLRQLCDWGVALDQYQVQALSVYLDLLAEYDLANIIGTKERQVILEDHLMDSFSCLMVREMYEARSVVDVGSGGGLPGIPLAIALPGARVVLLEATGKKARFLEYARNELALDNLQVLNMRAEDAGRGDPYRDTFDFAVSRALASLPVVLEYCVPLVRNGGRVLAMKGPLREEEISAGDRASKELRVKLEKAWKVEHRSEARQKERRLVVFKKIGSTPGRFPRRVGLAKKQPLGG